MVADGSRYNGFSISEAARAYTDLCTRTHNARNLKLGRNMDRPQVHYSHRSVQECMVASLAISK